MCGIAGQYSFQGLEPSQSLIQSMGEKISHRGPDGEGYFIEAYCGMAHRRLAIIDLDPRSNQPMMDRSQRYVISWNGECYNYLELRNTLELQGCRFKTESDTEVVLEGIARWGIDFVQKINGMFAFALFDRKENTLILCRDRIGIKPLYWSHRDEDIFFASEVKPLLESLSGEPELNHRALESYLKLRYVPGSTTLFKGIKKVDPGHYIEMKPSGEIKIKSYWDLSRHSLKRGNLSLAEAKEEFYGLLKESVGLRLRSDVGVGSFLSSGVDSSAIAALAGAETKSLSTYTLNMVTNKNEVSLAAQYAKAKGFVHHEILFEEDELESIEKAIWSLEEPLGDSIIGPSLTLNQFASKNHKVILSGEGADEVLMGYAHHKVLPFLNALMGLVPLNLRCILADGLRGVPNPFLDYLSPYPASFGATAKNRLVKILRSNQGASSYLKLVELFDDQDLDNLFNFHREDLAQARLNEPFIRQKKYNYGLQAVDLLNWCPNYTLQRVDKLSMAFGMEVRVPFLDHKIIEFCLSLPSHLLGGSHQKSVLRHSMADSQVLPKNIAYRKKYPFFLPVEQLLTKSKKEKIKSRILDSPKLESLGLKRPFLEELLSGKNLSTFEYKQIICLYNLIVWSEFYLTDGWQARPI